VNEAVANILAVVELSVLRTPFVEEICKFPAESPMSGMISPVVESVMFIIDVVTTAGVVPSKVSPKVASPTTCTFPEASPRAGMMFPPESVTFIIDVVTSAPV
jgi:hypothetical protein